MIYNIEYTGEKSSADNPFGFFEYFFSVGFLSFSQQLGNLKGQVEFSEKINEDENDDVERLETPLEIRTLLSDNFFENGIQSLLKKEVQTSVEYTNELLLRKNSEESQKRFVHLLFSRLTDIIDNKLNTIPQKIKKQTKEILISYFHEIYHLYPELIYKGNTVYKKHLFPSLKNSTLKMKDDKFIYLPNLYRDLTKGGYIENKLPYELFKKAFNGSLIEEPLNIKWIKIRGKEMNFIASLARMLKVMTVNHYIEPYVDAQLSNIFTRKDGEPIDKDEWKSFRQSAKNGKDDILDEIEIIAKGFIR